MKIKLYSFAYKISKNWILICLTLFTLTFFVFENASAASVTIATDGGADMGPLEILFLMLLIGLGPAIILMMTSFTRIIIVLSFARNALGTQQSPPNQVLLGIALFLTLFIMSPVLNDINEVAYQPYKNKQINQEQAFSKASVPLKNFMLKQTQSKDLDMFLNISKKEFPEDMTEEQRIEALDFSIIVPSFITSEIKRAFIIGFLIFIPFLIIDMVVSSTLMSMGMVMLPPTTIALPFKILMFVLVDGWSLLFGTLSQSFRF